VGVGVNATCSNLPRHMSIEEKQPFLDMAETLKKQHHLDHPDYRFKPKQRSTTGHRTMVKKLQQQQHHPSACSFLSSCFDRCVIDGFLVLISPSSIATFTFDFIVELVTVVVSLSTANVKFIPDGRRHSSSNSVDCSGHVQRHDSHHIRSSRRLVL
jgi:hypothetical protein